MARTNTNLAQALAFFDQVETKLRDDRPPGGFYTARELAEERGVNCQFLKMKLDRMVRQRLVERKAGRLGGKQAAFYRL